MKNRAMIIKKKKKKRKPKGIKEKFDRSRI